MVLTSQKPKQRMRLGEHPEGLPGSTKSAVYVARSIRNLGDPSGSCLGEVLGNGIRLLSHARGNPDTEVGRSLSHSSRPCR